MTSASFAKVVLVGLALALGSCGARTPLDIGAGAVGNGSGEQCNGKDDDGDGLIDEDIPAQHCGSGVCEQTVPGCVAGVVPPCHARTPSPEICDGIDNNCDGAVDEGLPLEAVEEVRMVARETALATLLAETPQGLRAFWRGADLTIQNLRTVALDLDGSSVGGTRTIPTRPIYEGPRLTPLPQGGWLFGYCGLIGGNDHRLTGLELDFSGNPRGPERTHLGQNNCSASAPGVHFTGSRQLFGMATNSQISSDWRTPAMYETATPDGTSRSAGQLVNSGSPYVPPRFAQGATRIGFVTGSQATVDTGVTLAIGTFDARAADAPPVVPAKELPIPHGGFTTVRSAAIATVADDRFLVVAHSDHSPGVLRVRFTGDGTIEDGPTPIIAGELEYDMLELVPSAPGYVLVGGSSQIGGAYGLGVFRLNGDGAITSKWTTRDAVGEPAWPSVVVRDGRIYVLYAWVTEHAENEVRLVVLGCR